MNSLLGQINIKDILKGLIVSVGTAVLTTVIQMLNSQAEIDLKTIGIVATSAFLTYILKQLGTDERNKFMGIL